MSEESQDHWNYWSHQTGARTLEAFCFVKPSMEHRLGPQASSLAYMGQFPYRTSELKIKRTGKVGAIPIQIQFPTPMQGLITIYNSSPQGSSVLQLL